MKCSPPSKHSAKPTNLTPSRSHSEATLSKQTIAGKRLFVLDTNVLMHDPTALFRFHEHDVFLPMAVLEELDNAKVGMTEVARNVRQTNRFLDELTSNATHSDIEAGLPLDTRSAALGNGQAARKLSIQTRILKADLPDGMPGSKKDLYSGRAELGDDFWSSHGDSMDSWQKEGRTFYRVKGPQVETWHPNQCLAIGGERPMEVVVRSREGDSAVLEVMVDFRKPSHSVWGINARNVDQNFALNLLMDPDIDFVSLVGQAGTGKTLLTLAAGLAQTLDDKRYSEIIMTRVTIPVGEAIGFLPGTEEEKMTPWMGALMDNLEVLTKTDQGGGDWGRAATNDLIHSRIRIRSLNFMRGRTFLNKYLILDEAQNLTSKQMKTLVTRAGPGTKVICLGNIAQIDTPYLTETSSGLTYVVDRFKDWEHSGHIILRQGERSRLADFASGNL
ncbi:MAG: PhoH family protein [Gammaproteobacteria bacterium]|nr:PhoH family protein [Gammaproteobacteria bacterium]